MTAENSIKSIKLQDGVVTLFTLVMIITFGLVKSAVPLISGGIIYSVGKKWFGESRRPFVPVLSSLASHIGLIIASTITLIGVGGLSVVGFSSILSSPILVGGTVWLGIKPGRWPLSVLFLLSGAMLVWTMIGVRTGGSGQTFDMPNPSGLHTFLWAFGLVMIAIRLYEMRSQCTGTYAMSKQTISFIRSMPARFPGLEPVLTEHVGDNREILPHLFFGDVTRYALSLVRVSRPDQAPELHLLLDFLEESFSSGDRELQELIAVSFLENLQGTGDKGAHIIAMLGPNLTKQWRLISPPPAVPT
jgi:hypothetical protein